MTNDQDPAELFDGPVRIPGMESRFPGPMTPGELHRLQEIEAIHALLNGAGVPDIIGNRRLTVSERVRLALEITK